MKPTRTRARTRQVLLRARELVKKGWCQNKLVIGGEHERDPKCTHYCVLGAIAGAAHQVGGNQFAATAFWKHHTGISDPGAWNDSSWRRKGHVLEAFDVAIAQAKEEPP